MDSETRARRSLDGIMLLLCMVGFGLCLWLFAQARAAGAASVAGCGGGPCDEVLQSRWSGIFRIPVAVVGAVAYLGLAYSFVPRFRWLHVPALGAILGAALWFVFVQSVLLGKFCPWCMTAHVVALTLGVLGFIRPASTDRKRARIHLGLWAGLAAAGLALGQIFGPVPATHTVDTVASTGSQTNLEPLPQLGPGSAKHVIIEYFDYNCPSCRTMGRYLETLRNRHPEEISVICLPVPMDETCNAHVPAGAHQPGGCELARAALAVWFARPEAFPAFHRELLEHPFPERVDGMAREIMSEEAWAAAKADPRIEAAIQSNIAGWKRISVQSTVLPKLVIRNQRLVQGAPATEAEFLRVMEAELGYP